MWHLSCSASNYFIKEIDTDLYELVKGNTYKDSKSVYLNNEGNKKVADVIESYL